MYVIYEKDFIERLGVKINNQINIGDSSSVDGIVKIFELKRNVKLSKRVIYKAIKTQLPIYDRYYIYKIKI